MLLRCSPFHFFGDFSAVNFAAMHWIPLSNTLNIRILQWIPLNTAVDFTERCSGLHRWPQWHPLLAVVDSSAVFQWNSLNSFNTNLQKLSTIKKKWSSCTSVTKYVFLHVFSFENEKHFQNQQVSQKEGFGISPFGSELFPEKISQSFYSDARTALPL